MGNNLSILHMPPSAGKRNLKKTLTTVMNKMVK